MARSPSGRRGRGPSDLGGTLGSLLRSTWEQAGAVREVIERAAGTGRARLDEALTDRKRTAALAELGEIVLELVRQGELDLDELPEIRASIDALDRLDAAAEEAGEGRGASVWGSRSERTGSSGREPTARFDDRDVRELRESFRSGDPDERDARARHSREDREAHARHSRDAHDDRDRDAHARHSHDDRERGSHDEPGRDAHARPAHDAPGSHGSHAPHGQRENFPRFVPRPSFADRRLQDPRVAAASDDELDDEYDEYDPAPEDSPSLDLEERTSPESPFGSSTRRFATTKRLRAVPPRHPPDDASSSSRRASDERTDRDVTDRVPRATQESSPSGRVAGPHDSSASGRIRAAHDASGSGSSRAASLDPDYVHDAPPSHLDDDEALLTSDLSPSSSPPGLGSRPATRSTRVTAPVPLSDLRAADRGPRLRPDDTRPGRPAHLRGSASDDDGTVSSSSWRPPSPAGSQRIWRPDSPASSSSERSTEPAPLAAAALAPAPSPGRSAQDIPGVVRFDDLPGAAALQAQPSPPPSNLRGGGISFDDDDLADYMHPDDVPKRPES